ncbi:GMC family oxidoreductase N-terminal domain-containing protein [Actinoplanes sp. NPDC049596]|uniref:GMC family oxidoreductase n=1 Tax=unclassified Actinoplanes TaxID=2626549 RepID=UPI003431DF40
MKTPDIREADYVVVGGGTAGSVLAARLSEMPDTTVVLVEAGSAAPPTAPPAQWPSLLATDANWAFSSVPQPELAGQTVPYPRGRGLGGSTVINAMAHIRGHRQNYDQWVSEGATGWGYDDLLPYFRRSETARGADPRYRGTNGPMTVGPAPVVHPFMEIARAAVAERGIPLSPDLNGADQEGAGFFEYTIVDGERQSAADAYLRPILAERPNLGVVTDATVTRLVVEDRACTGVELRGRDGATSRIRAGEVILCAGVFGSPQLLMLSGIGPAADLRGHGIDVVADRAGVGAHLQDHPVCTFAFGATQEIPRRSGTGTLIAVVRSSAGLPAPDLQLSFVEYPFFPLTGTDVPGGFSISMQAVRPLSRGRVTLASADPLRAPLIDPGFYREQRDLDTMLAGFGLIRDIAAAEAFDAIRAGELVPGPAVITAAQQREFLRRATHSAAHPVGTCRMGSDAGSVVDTSLRVHGVERLRVADASVMPSLIGANTNATVLAIAEKAADLIRAGQ